MAFERQLHLLMMEIRFPALTTIMPCLKRLLRETVRVFLTSFCEGYEGWINKAYIVLIERKGRLLRVVEWRQGRKSLWNQGKTRVINFKARNLGYGS